jgi:hypothetical protein
MKLTKYEIDYISNCPDGLQVAMDYHDQQMCEIEAMGCDCSAHQKRFDDLKLELDRIRAAWEGK